jgi:hypothetical protein
MVVVTSDPANQARSRVESGASATLRVVSPEHVEIWYEADPKERGAADPEAAAAREHEILTSTPDATERFAARVIEQVRARLVTLSYAPGQKASDVPAPPPHALESQTAKANPRAPATRHALWAETGVAATAAGGGVPATIQALVGLRALVGSVELEAFGLLPLTDGNVQAKEGSADVTISLVGAGAGYVLSDEGAPLQGSLGAGAGVLFLTMEGEAAPPYAARKESLTTAAFFLDGGVRYRAADWLGVRLSTQVGLYAPRPVIEFAGREVAAWGRGFGTVALTLEFGTPFFVQRSK